MPKPGDKVWVHIPCSIPKQAEFIEEVTSCQRLCYRILMNGFNFIYPENQVFFTKMEALAASRNYYRNEINADQKLLTDNDTDLIRRMKEMFIDLLEKIEKMIKEEQKSISSQRQVDTAEMERLGDELLKSVKGKAA